LLLLVFWLTPGAFPDTSARIGERKNTKRQEEMPDEDMEVVEDFINIELEEGEEK